MSTKNNPFAGAQMVLKNGNPIEELRFGGSNLRALSSSTGEVNAYSKKDLLNSITRLMSEADSGNILQSNSANNPARNSAAMQQERQERRDLLAAAYADPNMWEALGSSIATQISEQGNRVGFMRRLLVGNTLRQGEIARITMPTHDVVAVVATSPANVGYQMVRSRVYQPDEFEITANVRVNIMDIEQVHADLLDYAYNEAVASTVVREDRLFKKAADMSVGMFNSLQYIAGDLTPELLSTIRQTVAGWNLPATSALIANDYWTDITGNSDFGTLLDPITKYDLILNGHIATLLGMSLITDAFRSPTQKVLERGEIYVVSDPEFLGAYTDRGGVRSSPTSGADQGNSTRGWFLNEILSMTLVNCKAIAKGRRL